MPQVLKEEVRTSIIAAAKVEFFRKGFDGSSIRSIAKIAGVTPGNLYRYFDNKEALYENVVGTAYRYLNRILEENTHNRITIDEKPTMEQLEALVNANPKEIVKRVVLEVMKEFEENRMGLLILLKDRREEPIMNTRYGLTKWFEAHFELIYRNSDIAPYLAHSFTEGLIKIALDEERLGVGIIEDFVNFYFLRGIQS